MKKLHSTGEESSGRKIAGDSLIPKLLLYTDFKLPTKACFVLLFVGGKTLLNCESRTFGNPRIIITFCLRICDSSYQAEHERHSFVYDVLCYDVFSLDKLSTVASFEVSVTHSQHPLCLSVMCLCSWQSFTLHLSCFSVSVRGVKLIFIGGHISLRLPSKG